MGTELKNKKKSDAVDPELLKNIDLLMAYDLLLEEEDWSTLSDQNFTFTDSNDENRGPND